MKHLVVPDEATAKAKAHQALEAQCPNRRILQLALHNADPRKYDHPDTFDWDNDLICGYFEAADGSCELFMEDDVAEYFNISDRNQMADGLQTAMENIIARRPN